MIIVKISGLLDVEEVKTLSSSTKTYGEQDLER